MKVVTVVGARPQFIKAAMVSRRLRATPGLVEKLIHTGQHYDYGMSDVFFEELAIPRPDNHLGIGSASHGAQTGRMLETIEGVLLGERPDWVLVYGDTNSTLAGALAAAKLHVPVAHVEAGLRSHNRMMPEEINRILTDHTADLLFAPTPAAVANLHREGLPAARIRLSGDVMLDAAMFYRELAEQRSHILQELALQPSSYILATIHRAENTDDRSRLHAIFKGLALVAQEVPVVLPLHPRTEKALRRESLLKDLPPTLRIIDPVGYLDMIRLEQNARLIATDSGGVQKEAFFYGVPCATLRSETEWVELVALGWNQILPPENAEAVASGLRNCMTKGGGREGAPYGKGDAAALIVDTLRAFESRRHG